MKTVFRPVLLGLSAAVAAVVHADDQVNMDSVVVTAAGFEQSLTGAPASITVITRQDLESTSFTNLAEAIANVPGVDVRTATGKTGDLDISIRGMPSDYTLILIDGRRQNTSGSVTPNGFGATGTGFMPPLSQIERIEVIRGPMSTLYGSQAMGGVVNIITRRVAEEWGGSINTQATLQQDNDIGNSREVGIYASGPLIENTLGAQIRAKTFDQDSSERMVEDSKGRDPRAVETQRSSFGGRLNFTPDANNEFWADIESARNTYSNDDNRLGTQDGTNRDGTVSPGKINGYKDELEFNRTQFAVGHKGNYSQGTLETSLTHTTTETLGRTLPAGNAPDYGYFANGGEDRTLENRDLILDSRFIMPLDNHVLTVGGQYVDAELEDAAAGSESFKQKSWALFAEDEWQLKDDLALTIGGRYENHDAFGGHFNPRSYLVWNADDNWTLKGGVSQGYKTPTLNQLHDGITGFSGQGTVVNIGSPDLEPEKSTNFEIGANFDNLRGLTAGATVFYTKFKDRIADATPLRNCQYTDGLGNQPYANSSGCISIGNFTDQEEFGQQTNIDKAETRGLELTAGYRINQNWDISGGYTYTDSEITSGDSKGEKLTNTPKHMLTADVTWKITDRWSSTLEGEYYSSRERFTGEASGQSASLVEQLGNKLDSYAIFNLKSSYQVTPEFRLIGSINNLLDKDFSDADTYTHNGETEVAYNYIDTGRSTSGVALDRRNLWLSAIYDF